MEKTGPHSNSTCFAVRENYRHWEWHVSLVAKVNMNVKAEVSLSGR